MRHTVATRIDHPIRLLLFERRISHRELAEALGYGVVLVERSVNGRGPVSAAFALRCSEYLQVPVEQLFAEISPGRCPKPSEPAA
jgi:transcriptional regulator with XRE-family HTH domain